jgi:Uma2 family endonuclease
MAVSEQEFRKLALEDPDGHWELYCGRPRKKPDMTLDHNRTTRELFFMLRSQLDPARFDVSVNMGQVRISEDNYFIPDVYVIPVELQAALRGRRVLEAYEAPLPLVVEVWSPSTGAYDARSKLAEYQRRGDHEIWLIHPYDRTLTAWHRQLDGSYVETSYVGGKVQPLSLPGVTIDLDALFA